MPTAETQLAEAKIRDLAARYCDAVNRRDTEAWRNTWSVDAEWSLLGQSTRGRDAIVNRWLELMGTIPFVMQLPSFGVIDFPESGVGEEPQRSSTSSFTASGRWYINEISQRPTGAGMTIGVYRDLYIHSGEDDDWRFARRRFDILYRGQPDLSGKTFPSPDDSSD
jgi:hypothetical protein